VAGDGVRRAHRAAVGEALVELQNSARAAAARVAYGNLALSGGGAEGEVAAAAHAERVGGEELGREHAAADAAEDGRGVRELGELDDGRVDGVQAGGVCVPQAEGRARRLQRRHAGEGAQHACRSGCC
jgi:hypothetical protein